MPQSLNANRQTFAGVLQAWAVAKSVEEPATPTRFYATDFTADDKTRAAHNERQQGGRKTGTAKAILLSEVSFMRWTDEAEIMIATFGETTVGMKSGKTVRQYWQRSGGQWKIIHEAVVG